MARQRRIDIPNGIYHVITRGIDGKTIFKKPTDKREFLTQLEEVLASGHGQCYAWALMENHVHLCIRTGEETLANMMRRLFTKYAIYFNKHYKRHGYLFQNRYKSILCQEETYLQELIRYIHLNPVRAGVITKQEELDEYPWTGHSALVGKEKREWQNINEILLRYSENRLTAIERYKAFIEEGWEKPVKMGNEIMPKRKTGKWKITENHERWRGEEIILGDDEFISMVMKRAEEVLDQKDKLKRKWTADRLIKTICEKVGMKESELQQRSRISQLADVRGVIAYIGCCQIGLNGAELARRLGISRPAISIAQIRGKRIVEEKGICLFS